MIAPSIDQSPRAVNPKARYQVARLPCEQEPASVVQPGESNTRELVGCAAISPDERLEYFNPKVAFSPGLVVNQSITMCVHRPAIQRNEALTGVGVAIVNYNTTYQTLRCLESLRHSILAPNWIMVLDNASQTDVLSRRIADMLPYEVTELRLYRSAINLGFAEGCNRLIAALLAEPSCHSIILLNNDAVALPSLVLRLTQAIAGSASVGLAGGRMHKLDDPEQVDTLGISLYASLMPADRKSLSDPFLGPTGGCAILSRACLEDINQNAGYWFDPRFFCYCEDTDLVVRAILLGYQPVFVDELLALHEGQASSGGEGNRFIAYHGLRNAIWMVAKSIPLRLLSKHAPLLMMAHGMAMARQVLAGNARLMIKAYRDALRGLPAMWRERCRLRTGARAGRQALEARMARRFYRAGYARLVIRQLGARYCQKWRHPAG
jgi:GT2 family glycosyltransferase